MKQSHIIILLMFCWAITASASAGIRASNAAGYMPCAFTLIPGPDITICQPGQTVSLGATVIGPYLSAVWSPSTGLSNPNSPNTNATVNQTSTYTLTVTGLGATNLITNGNFNAGLSGFTSNYIPGTGGPWGVLSNEGTFAVATNSNLTHSGFANCSDHTGGGNMLVVNGSGTPNQNVWCQTVNVTPNTAYSFSAWGASVVSSSPAILQISINGGLLGSPFTLPGATCQWTQFFQLWNSGGASTAQICIVNQNTQPSGNDFAIDDIMFGPVCQETAQVTVNVVNLNASWTPPQGLCPFSPAFSLDALLAPGATLGGAWTINGVPGSFFNPLVLGPGSFTVSYTLSNPPCFQTSTQQIVINPLPNPGWAWPGVVCINAAPFPLNSLLFPNTATNGQWAINGIPAVDFNPAFLGTGFHTVTYTLGALPCANALTQLVEVTPLPNPAWTAPPPLCVSAASFQLNTLLAPGASPGGTWTIFGNNATVFNPAQLGPGAHPVTYQVGTFPCIASLTQFIHVNALPVAAWDGPDTLCQSSISIALNTWLLSGSTPGGIWTIDGQPATMLNPGALSAGIHQITYTVGVPGCQSTASGTIRIQAPLSAPVPSCSIVTGSTIEINWPPVVGAGNISVQVLSGQTPTASTSTSILFQGLGLGESVRIVVNAIPLGPCPPVAGDTLVCTTFLCAVLPVDILPVDTICLFPGAPSVTLQAVVPDTSGAGVGIWSGTGIVNTSTGVFNPAIAGPGTHTVYYFYNLNSCISTDSIQIVVAPRPVAAYSSNRIVCIADTSIVNFIGTAGPSAVFHWDFADATIISGSGRGPFALTWPSSGVRLVSLSVNDNGCTSLLYIDSFLVTPAIDTPIVFCNAALTEIEFSWNPLSSGSTVVAIVELGPPGINTSDTSFLVSGLTPGQAVRVRLTAGSTSVCPDVEIIVNCNALPCAALSVNIMPPDTVCLPAAAMVLEAQIAGASAQGTLMWSGPGIADPTSGLWIPDAGMAGQLIPIIATYAEGPCMAADTLWIPVAQTPTADFEALSPVCQDEPVLVTYLGTASSTAHFEWNFAGDPAATGTGEGPYQLIWDAPGAYSLQLSVEENGCRSMPFEVLVQTDTILQTPEISCHSTYTSVDFAWRRIPGAIGFNATVLSGQTALMLTDTSLRVENLSPGEAVEIIVHALSGGACPDSEAGMVCTALVCADISVTIAPVATVCWDGVPETILLEAIFEGDPGAGQLQWSGPGIVDAQAGLWQTDASMAGQNITLIATYTDQVCTAADTLQAPVFLRPNASFLYDEVLCLTESNEIAYIGNASPAANYIWDFGGGNALPGSGQGPHVWTFSNPGAYSISLTVEENGCVSRPLAAEITVNPPLATPVIQCEATYTSIIFTWAPVANAAPFMANTTSGQPGVLLSDTSYSVSGLMPGEQVGIVVGASSTNLCPPIMANASCATLPCPNVSLAIAQPPQICWDGSADTLQLSVQLNGAPASGVLRWEGEGIINAANGAWASRADMAGRSIWAKAVFTDDVCVFEDSIAIPVFAVPDIGLQWDSVICVSDALSIQYTGNAAPTAAYFWNFSTGNATPGAGPGPHSVRYIAPGQYVITLSVEENGCVSRPLAAEITVNPPLATPVIQCEATYTSIIFTWAPVANAAPFMANTTSGQPGVLLSNTSYSVSGLMPGEQVGIAVGASSTNLCPPIMANASCTTLPCPNVSLALAQAPQICWDGSADTLQLSVQLNGAPASGVLRWEGEGIINAVNGAWASRADMVGRSIWAKAVFTDDVCVFEDSIAIPVFAVPDIGLQWDSVICVSDALSIQYTGNAAPTAAYFWNFSTGNATPGAGPGPHSVHYIAPGQYVITLSVEENGCVSRPDSARVRVEPFLAVPLPVCQSDYTSIIFSWPAIPGASAYQLALPPGINPDWLADTSVLIANLTPSTPVSISVEAVSAGACPNTSASTSCQTIACPSVSLSVQSRPVVCTGDSARLQFFISGPAGTLLDLTLSDGVRTWNINNVQNGSATAFLPVQSINLSVISAINTQLPFCAVSLPEPISIAIERPPFAGTALTQASVCAFADTLVQLAVLLQNADPGGGWTIFPGSATPAPGAFQPVPGTFNSRQNNTGVFRFLYTVPAGAACPGDTTSVVVQVLPLPPADAGPDRTLDCLNRILSVGSGGNPNFLYRWSSTTGNLLDHDMPMVEVDMPGVYRLEVINPATGCRAFDEVRVSSEIAVLEPSVSVRQMSCYGVNDGLIYVESVTGGTAPLLYSMNGGSFSPQALYSNLSPGIYNLVIRDAAGCETAMRFELLQPVEIEAILDPVGLSADHPLIALGDSLRLQVLVNLIPADIASIRWSPALCTDCPQVSILPTHTGSYAVTVTNTNGCTASARLTVGVDRRPAIFVPNAFSPNNDGLNDRLLVFAGKQVSYIRSFVIFDRWGESVFEVYNFPPNNPSYGWDGTHRGRALSPAVFVYYLEAETVDGEVHLVKGDVTLMR